MLAKLQALLPLLGWFYLSVFGAIALIGLLQIIRQKTLAIFVERAIFALVVCVTLLLTAQHIALEWKDTQSARTSFRDSAVAKIEQEVGGNYRIYYQTLRPFLQGVHDVNLIGVSVREYHFARMYLYPTLVLDAKTVDDGNTAYSIVPENQVGSLEQYKEITRIDGHVLMQKKGEDVR